MHDGLQVRIYGKTINKTGADLSVIQFCSRFVILSIAAVRFSADSIRSVPYSSFDAFAASATPSVYKNNFCIFFLLTPRLPDSWVQEYPARYLFVIHGEVAVLSDESDEIVEDYASTENMPFIILFQHWFNFRLHQNINRQTRTKEVFLKTERDYIRTRGEVSRTMKVYLGAGADYI